jgi:hypothetical protein
LDDEDYDHFDTERWHRVAEDCLKRELYPNEVSFVEDMIAMTLRGYRPTTAQANWLMKIHRRREVGDEKH